MQFYTRKAGIRMKLIVYPTKKSIVLFYAYFEIMMTYNVDLEHAEICNTAFKSFIL